MYLCLSSEAEQKLDFLLLGSDAASQREASQDLDFQFELGTAHLFRPESNDGRYRLCLFVEAGPGRPRDVARPTIGDSSVGVVEPPFPGSAATLLAGAVGHLLRIVAESSTPTPTPTPDSSESESESESEIEIEIEIELNLVPVRGGIGAVRRIFEPLGYVVKSGPAPGLTDDGVLGQARSFVPVVLGSRQPVEDILSQLSVLLPALDGCHGNLLGPVQAAEVLAAAARWLPDHPDRDFVTERYRTVLDQGPGFITGLASSDPVVAIQPGLGGNIGLNERRMATVIDLLLAHGAELVIDLGCGEGRVIERMVSEPSIRQIVGVDFSREAVDRAADRLKLDEGEIGRLRRRRIWVAAHDLLQSAPEVDRADAVVAVEVIEHIEIEHLERLAEVVFGQLTPSLVVLTTPNREYNVHLDLPELDSFRHTDHRFEWTRQEFRHWATQVADKFRYQVTLAAIGEERPGTGAQTQLGIFRRQR